MCAAYGVGVPLTAAEDERLGQWAAQTPGATWPSWGGHITVIPAIEVGDNDSALADAIAEVAQRTKLFRVALDCPAPKPHAFISGDWTVQLVVERATPLEDLRAELWQALEPIGVDVLPEARRDWYDFHLSLIGRGSRAEAESVAAAATDADLKAEFTADSVELIAHPTNAEGAYRVSRRFALLGGP